MSEQEQTQNQPENQETGQKEEKKPDFNDLLNERRRKYEKQIAERTYKGYGSIGKTTLEQIRIKFNNSVRAKQREFLKKRKEILAQGQTFHQQMMNEMVEQADNEFASQYAMTAAILDHYRGGDQIDENELVHIENMVDAVSKMKANPAKLKLFEKISGEQELEYPDDYDEIISQINPIDLKLDLQARQVFEQSQSGALIGMMQPDERIKLIKRFYETKPPDDATLVLESLFVHSIISKAQLDSLLRNGTVPAEQAATINRNAPHLNKKRDQYKQVLQVLGIVNEGRNQQKSTLLAGALFAGLAGYGGTLAATNIAANFDFKRPLASLREGLNAYTALGAGAAAVGVAGVMREIAPERTRRVVDSVIKFFAGPEKLKELSDQNKDDLMKNMLQPMKENPAFTDFLQSTSADGKTGFDKVKELNQDVAEKKIEKFTFQELRQRTSGDQQKNLDIALSDTTGSTPQQKRENLAAQLSLFEAAGRYVDVNTSADLNRFIEAYNKAEGIE